MFQADNNTSPEIIFAIRRTGCNTQTYGGVNFLIHASAAAIRLGNAVMGVDGCWYGTRLKPRGVSSATMRPRDKRASFIYTSGQTARRPTASATSAAAYPAPKFQNVTSDGAPGSNPGFADTDFPVFRLGEAYLIYAEAAVRGGGGDDRPGADVRERASAAGIRQHERQHHSSPAHDCSSFSTSGAASCCGKHTVARIWFATVCSRAPTTSGRGRVARPPGRPPMRT